MNNLPLGTTGFCLRMCWVWLTLILHFSLYSLDRIVWWESLKRCFDKRVNPIIKKFTRGKHKPWNMEELFNLRHCSLNSAIDWPFGIVNTFNSQNMLWIGYSFLMPRKIVVCCFFIHSFIRRRERREGLFKSSEGGEDKKWLNFLIWKGKTGKIHI